MNKSEKFTRIIPPPDVHSYPQLLEQLAAGSRQAFHWLYVNQSRCVYEYALLLSGNEALSEDVVQDVFCKLWQRRKTLSGVKDLKSYLHRMARNRLVSHWRRQAVEKNYREHQKHIMALSGDAGDSTKELSDIIYQAVERLPRQQKIVYLLKREENWKKARIARALHLSPETVKAHMYQALRSIKTFVKEKL